MVFQDYSLYPHMSVFDNIAFGLKMRKTPLDTIKKGVKKVADILALEDLLKRKPKELSGGQRQRVALGRAIVRNPDVFLFDEPLSNLDAKLRIKTRVEIQRLHKKLMTTAIYVTHDQIEAMTMGDRIVVMDEGIIQQVGTPLDLYNRPANRFVGGFIGNPTMNFIDAEFERYGTELKLRIKNYILSLPPDIRKIIDQVGYSQKEVTIGIRPENLECTNKDVPGETIPAIVEVIEPLGSETYLYVKMNGTQLTLKTAPNLSFEIQQKVILRPNVNQFHLFDKSDGTSLFSL
jgi:multiple sugar transport system ATP-binding protein